jgi:hypothetical protein
MGKFNNVELPGVKFSQGDPVLMGNRQLVIEQWNAYVQQYICLELSSGLKWVAKENQLVLDGQGRNS